MMAFLSFLKTVLSEDGQGSYSRFAGFMIVLATLVWVTYLVIKNKVMPDLTGPTAFITVSSGSHYLTNKASSIISSITGKNTDSVQNGQ